MSGGVIGVYDVREDDSEVWVVRADTTYICKYVLYICKYVLYISMQHAFSYLMEIQIVTLTIYPKCMQITYTQSNRLSGVGGGEVGVIKTKRAQHKCNQNVK